MHQTKATKQVKQNIYAQNKHDTYSPHTWIDHTMKHACHKYAKTKNEREQKEPTKW